LLPETPARPVRSTVVSDTDAASFADVPQRDVKTAS
jgi:hypothetical protein